MDKIFSGNAAWSDRISKDEPDLFPRLAQQQTPEFFWIGCADSRVPANVVAGLDPGEVFVHRNVANVIHTADLNMLSALEYAVMVLGVRHVIVCGHYGCGGVRAAMEPEPGDGLAHHWIEPIRRLAAQKEAELANHQEFDARADRLTELNVLQSVQRVAETPIMRRAWAQGKKLAVHGLIYGLKDGRLRDLNCSINGDG